MKKIVIICTICFLNIIIFTACTDDASVENKTIESNMIDYSIEEESNDNNIIGIWNSTSGEYFKFEENGSFTTDYASMKYDGSGSIRGDIEGNYVMDSNTITFEYVLYTNGRPNGVNMKRTYTYTIIGKSINLQWNGHSDYFEKQ